MRNTGLEEAQAGIKISGRKVNNGRYADDTTLMAESKEELKSILMKVKKESGKVGLKLNIQEPADSAYGGWGMGRRLAGGLLRALRDRVVASCIRFLPAWRCACSQRGPGHRTTVLVEAGSATHSGAMS